jgi:hypothetical protein
MLDIRPSPGGATLSPQGMAIPFLIREENDQSASDDRTGRSALIRAISSGS